MATPTIVGGTSTNAEGMSPTMKQPPKMRQPDRDARVAWNPTRMTGRKAGYITLNMTVIMHA